MQTLGGPEDLTTQAMGNHDVIADADRVHAIFLKILFSRS
jgi:hypothetical protein